MTNSLKAGLNGMIAFLIVLILFIIFTNKCSTPVIPDNSKPDHSALTKSDRKDDSVIQITKRKVDTLILTKTKYVNRYITVYDSLYITDTICQGSLKTLYNSFQLVSNVNDSIISNKDTIIARLEHKVISKQSRVSMDSTYIVRLCDSIPKVKRKGYFKGLRHGVVIGAVIAEGVNVVSKLKL